MDEGVIVLSKFSIPVEAALKVIGGKWKVVILCHLFKDKYRTSELKRLMPNVSQKMLVQQLRELEQDGVIRRVLYHQAPPKVEYELTDYGRSLKSTMDVLCDWGEQHLQNEHLKNSC